MGTEAFVYDAERSLSRDKDTFGSSDFDKEAKQRKQGDIAAACID
ncbi:hypothetical protein [Burkholderia sp. BCC0397]|nr:hypothetical protein [Burkholderia sp. BCC0397]